MCGVHAAHAGRVEGGGVARKGQAFLRGRNEQLWSAAERFDRGVRGGGTGGTGVRKAGKLGMRGCVGGARASDWWRDGVGFDGRLSRV